MKPGLPPTPPDDEGLDPLLATLRQRLGDYGEAPPPAAWAAIRQRVAPPPLPWWRQGQHLLPLLVLLTSLLLVSRPTGYRSAEQASRPASAGLSSSADQQHLVAGSARSRATAPSAPRHASAGAAVLSASPMALDTSEELGRASHVISSDTSIPAIAPAALLASKSALALSPQNQSGVMHPARKATPTGTLLARGAQRAGIGLATGFANKNKPTLTSIVASSHEVTSPVHSRHAHNGQRAARRAHVALRRAAASQPLAAGAAADSQHYTPATLASSARLRARRRPTRPTQAAHQADAAARRDASATAAASQPTATSSLPAPALAAEGGTSVDTLALKQLSLLLPEAAFSPVLAARPDSTPPPPLARRWSVLVLAGPTLSYRTLGPAPALAAGRPDFARLERPAMGLGAQVQVRRVLSGRWALAVGVGYHEYATQLALSVKDSTTYRAVRQRDTYRLLTVPVQFSYALGAPRRLAAGLLLGAEPGWYLGGRSTEGSGCHCEQQAYSSAAGSPYRPLSVAFSLGLDLRYRLGGPASRWQWLVQPTGRYVATPFVRSEVVGFTRRQPFSLGLLTGFSWDVR